MGGRGQTSEGKNTGKMITMPVSGKSASLSEALDTLGYKSIEDAQKKLGLSGPDVERMIAERYEEETESGKYLHSNDRYYVKEGLGTHFERQYEVYERDKYPTMVFRTTSKKAVEEYWKKYKNEPTIREQRDAEKKQISTYADMGLPAIQRRLSQVANDISYTEKELRKNEIRSTAGGPRTESTKRWSGTPSGQKAAATRRKNRLKQLRKEQKLLMAAAARANNADIEIPF